MADVFCRCSKRCLLSRWGRCLMLIQNRCLLIRQDKWLLLRQGICPNNIHLSCSNSIYLFRSAADVCPVATADIYHVFAEHIWSVLTFVSENLAADNREVSDNRLGAESPNRRKSYELGENGHQVPRIHPKESYHGSKAFGNAPAAKHLPKQT